MKRKTAYIYIRVSTDEQAQTGYSLRFQEQALKDYCERNDIKIDATITEDYSAKSFNRPEWNKLVNCIKKKVVNCDLLLFTKWDRFSRNTSSAYEMISFLKKKNITPQAVEQPLDLSIPENKILLAIYLATPEVENERRGLNTKVGIRQAKKEGRFTGFAPAGYINKTTECGKRYIAISEQAIFVKWAFKEISKGISSIEEVRKKVEKQGLKCSKNNFYRLLRNPVYYGKIIIPAYGNEDKHLITGQHKPIISESLFFKVQDVINERKLSGNRMYNTALEHLELRGFLICPNCQRLLTGSSSKGKTKYFSYYHCRSECGKRFRADFVIELFAFELGKYKLNPFYSEKIKEIIALIYERRINSKQEDKNRIANEISKFDSMIEKALELLTQKKIELAEFLTLKTRILGQREILVVKQNKLSENKNYIQKELILARCLESFGNLGEIYEQTNIERKRTLLGLILDGKLTYSNNNFLPLQIIKATNLIQYR